MGRIISSIQKALDILKLFNSEVYELRNTDISAMLDIPPGTVSSLVYTLKENRYLEQDPVNKKYHLGIELLTRASVLLNHLDLRKIAFPYLEELRDWCGESVNLALRNNNEVIYIERMAGFHALRIHLELGKRAPIHSTSLGKAIAAFLPEDECRNLFKDYNFSPITKFTITDRELFINDLKVIRDRGYAIDEQENEIGGRCIGAPIFNHQNYPIAALSVSVPIQRLPIRKIDVYGQRIKMTSNEISQKLGYK